METITDPSGKSGFRAKLQRFGAFLAGMVIPNIGAFIAWGLITALFIPTGWIPNERLGELVGPMITFMLPLLIGYQGGKLVYDTRGGVVGAVATAGVIVGSSVPMFIGAMIMGPLGGYVIKKFDKLVENKIPTGFEMLVNNFSAGILGALLSILAFLVIEPVVNGFSVGMGNLAQSITEKGLLPLTALFIEPGKILFLNNAIDHGILGPLGVEQVTHFGKSIFFLLVTNPGPGLGVLLAYWFHGKGSAKESAPGAIIIHFLGGIHEIYFPYVLMSPLLILSVIGGGLAANLTFVVTKAGLVATPSPGSIFALIAMAPKGGLLPVLSGVAVGTIVSFLIAAPIVRRGSKNICDEAQIKSDKLKVNSKEVVQSSTELDKDIKLIIFACEAGMGSSAMGESILKKKIKDAGLDITVKHCPVTQIPSDAEVVFVQENLAINARKRVPEAHIIIVKNFLDNTIYDDFVNELKNKMN